MARKWAETCSQLKKPNTFVLCVDWIIVLDCGIYSAIKINDYLLLMECGIVLYHCSKWEEVRKDLNTTQ